MNLKEKFLSQHQIEQIEPTELYLMFREFDDIDAGGFVDGFRVTQHAVSHTLEFAGYKTLDNGLLLPSPIAYADGLQRKIFSGPLPRSNKELQGLLHSASVTSSQLALVANRIFETQGEIRINHGKFQMHISPQRIQRI